jgi:uncharacterized protein YfbU (UPF0304 family)
MLYEGNRKEKKMKLSDSEKLILIMLSEIYEKLQLDGEIDPKLIKSAIFSGNTWGINWQYSGIPFEDDDTPEIVKEVVNILDMWSFIEDSYENLSEKDKLLVEKEAKPFGKDPKFRGFDGNNETYQMGIAMFLIDDLNRFQKYKGRDLNSHSPSIDTYRRMYTVFEPMRLELMGDLLNAKQLIQILLEKLHPEHR